MKCLIKFKDDEIYEISKIGSLKRERPPFKNEFVLVRVITNGMICWKENLMHYLQIKK